MGVPFHVQGTFSTFFTFSGIPLVCTKLCGVLLWPKTAESADGPNIPSDNSPTKQVGIEDRIQQIPASEKKQRGVECNSDFVSCQ